VSEKVRGPPPGPLTRSEVYGTMTANIERRNMEQASQEAARCAVGSATDNPCPRVATEFVNRKDRPDWCWPHLFSARLRDTIAEAEQMLRERGAELDDWLRSRQADQKNRRV
jgi:hypothetical protein